MSQIKKIKTGKGTFNVTKDFCSFNEPKYLSLGKVALFLTCDKWIFFCRQCSYLRQVPVVGETVSPEERDPVAKSVCTLSFLADIFEAGKKLIPLSNIDNSGGR